MYLHEAARNVQIIGIQCVITVPVGVHKSWTPPTPPLSVMAKVADSHTWTLKTVADMYVGHSCSQRVSFAPTSCVAMQAQGLLKRMVQSSC